MRQLNLKKIFKWVFCGIIVSFINNTLYIISLYFELSSIIYYFIPLPIATVVWLMIKEDKIKWIFLAIGVMVLSNFATEILLNMSNVVNYFYYRVYPDAMEIALGEGVLLVYIYGLSAIGMLLGWIVSFITTIWHVRKKRNIEE